MVFCVYKICPLVFGDLVVFHCCPRKMIIINGFLSTQELSSLINVNHFLCGFWVCPQLHLLLLLSGSPNISKEVNISVKNVHVISVWICRASILRTYISKNFAIWYLIVPHTSNYTSNLQLLEGIREELETSST